MEIFCLGEYDLLTYLTWIVMSASGHDGKNWMFATVLCRNWSLTVNILEDIAKSC